MSFKQMRKSARRSRKVNRLFFGSLVIAIVAFYTLLSLEDQDVMIFLKTMESVAVGKLMTLIPIIYIISLFFVFFLVYFAYRYQLDNRKKEFGLYLMLGMKRFKLFTMLMGETILNSLVSLLLGLPISLFLTEVISLATSRLVGIGLLGHNITFSPKGILGTVIGFVVVQLLSMLILSSSICRKEPVELLHSEAPLKQKSISLKKGLSLFTVSLILLICAYILGVNKLRTIGSYTGLVVLAILVFGCVGTFLFYKGLGSFIGYRIQKRSLKKAGLFTFTGRQIQENVLFEYKSLAVSSLLLLMAIACVSFGVGTTSSYSLTETRTADFSIKGNENELVEFLESEETKDFIDTYYPMKLGSVYDKGIVVTWDDLIANMVKLPQSDQRDNILENLAIREDPYLIPVSCYNNLLQGIGKEPIQLEENQVALYAAFATDIFNQSLLDGTYIYVDGEKRELKSNVYTENIVADREITIYLALIVSDEDYQAWAGSNNDILCWNVLLNQDIIKEDGLIGAITSFKTILNQTDLEYESFLNSIGRNLFYIVAASYLTIYLGILFMIIANTVVGLKYLMQQRTNKPRYLTLIRLGATTEQLCQSSKNQIRIFFISVLGLAVLNSIFAVWTLFTSIMTLDFQMPFIYIILIVVIAFLLLVMIEMIYIRLVEKASRTEILKLQVIDEGDR